MARINNPGWTNVDLCDITELFAAFDKVEARDPISLQPLREVAEILAASDTHFINAKLYCERGAGYPYLNTSLMFWARNGRYRYTALCTTRALSLCFNISERCVFALHESDKCAAQLIEWAQKHL